MGIHIWLFVESCMISSLMDLSRLMLLLFGWIRSCSMSSSSSVNCGSLVGGSLVGGCCSVLFASGGRTRPSLFDCVIVALFIDNIDNIV